MDSASFSNASEDGVLLVLADFVVARLVGVSLSRIREVLCLWARGESELATRPVVVGGPQDGEALCSRRSRGRAGP
jgi:hypothetical protein